MDREEYLNFIYNYTNFDVYSPDSVNLGDYVQSIAAQQFLPRVDRFVDRDNFDQIPNDGGCRLITNGWYHLSDARHVSPEDVHPLYVAFHINNVNDAANFPKVLLRLKTESKTTPVGCRDIGTYSFLQKFGVDCYFSSCLTTTLERKHFTHDAQREGVVFADFFFRKNPFDVRQRLFPLNRYASEVLNSIRIRKIIDRYDDGVVKTTTHECPLTVSHEDRFQMARNLLRTYANARLVVTSRIHAALPCLALGTPVILVARYDQRRFDGLGDLLNRVYIDWPAKNRIERDGAGNVVNPEAYKVHAEKLRQTCAAYIGSASF